MEKKYITRKNLPVLIILAILGILSYRYFSPFGKIVHYRFGSKLPGVEETTTFSSNEGNILKIPSQIIKTNQSRLSLKILSKDIKSAKAVLKFKKGPKEIKLGVRASEKDKFLYQPLYHSLLQDLNWEKIEENDFSLWQKEKEYQTLYDFINNPDQNKKTASYFVDKNKLLNFKLIEAKKEDKVVVNIPLRGSHSFLVRVDKKPLILKITKQDTNWYKGEDRFKISVLNGQNTLIEKTINDDGITDTSMLKADPQEKTITLENIEPGTYQVNMAYEGKTISDSIITKIEINQEKIIFKDGVFIEGNKPVILWTNSSKLDVLTSHTRSLQTLKIDNQYDIKIEKVKETYSLDLKSLTGEKEEGHLCQLNSPKSDLRISGNGYFAFSQDSFFDPEIIKTIDLAELDDLENIDYVLAAYSKPKEDNNWLTAEVFFDLENIKTDDDKLYFSLEVPDLNNYGGELEIDYLEIEINSGGFLAKKGAEEVKGIAVKDNIFSRVFHKIKGVFNKQENASKEKPTLTPAPATPTPTIAIEKISLPVKILNGGGEKGEAGRFAKVLAENGFTNTQTANADSYDYQDAIVRYRKQNKKEADKITELLMKDYQTIQQDEIATSSPELVVILGGK